VKQSPDAVTTPLVHVSKVLGVPGVHVLAVQATEPDELVDVEEEVDVDDEVELVAPPPVPEVEVEVEVEVELSPPVPELVEVELSPPVPELVEVEVVAVLLLPPQPTATPWSATAERAKAKVDRTFISPSRAFERRRECTSRARRAGYPTR
jgi:hypothetical protein